MAGESLTFNQWAQPETKAGNITSRYMTWQGFRQVAAESWKEIDAYRYATDTNSLPSDSAFDHTTHIPIVGEVHDDLEAIMYATILPHNDWLGFTPYDLESATKEKRQKALAYIKNRHSLNSFRPCVRTLIDDYISYGNAFVQTVHCDDTYFTEDGDMLAGYVGPKSRRISPYEIVFNPTAPTFEESPKIVRELISMGEFIKRSRSDSSKYDEEVVKQVKGRRGSYLTVDMVEQNQNQQYTPDGYNSIESYMESGQVEILWFYGDVYDEDSGELHERRCVGVVDRVNCLFDFECPNPRIRHVGWHVKPDNLWAQSPLARIIGINYQIDHRENAKSDALDKYIYPDRLYAGDVDEVYDDETGQVKYIASEGGSVTDISPDTTVLTFDSQIDRLTAQARSAARLPPQLAGFRTPGEKTLGEVQSLNDGAFRGFIHKAEHFELQLLEPLISDELEIGRKYLSTAMTVTAEPDENGLTFLDISQDDLRSNGKLVPYGARRFARELQQFNTLNMLGNSNLLQIVNPHINGYNLAQAIETLGGFTDLEVFGKFAAIDEQAEQQLKANTAEKQVMSQTSQPSVEETMLQQEIDNG